MIGSLLRRRRISSEEDCCITQKPARDQPGNTGTPIGATLGLITLCFGMTGCGTTISPAEETPGIVVPTTDSSAGSASKMQPPDGTANAPSSATKTNLPSAVPAEPKLTPPGYTRSPRPPDREYDPPPEVKPLSPGDVVIQKVEFNRMGPAMCELRVTVVNNLARDVENVSVEGSARIFDLGQSELGISSAPERVIPASQTHVPQVLGHGLSIPVGYPIAYYIDLHRGDLVLDSSTGQLEGCAQ